MLTFWRFDNLIVISYLDSKFVVYLSDHKSTIGYTFMMAGEIVPCKSIKQSFTTTSIIELK